MNKLPTIPLAVDFKMPPFFEFFNDELFLTAKDFWKKQILRPPFPVSVFHTHYHEKNNTEPMLMKVFVSTGTIFKNEGYKEPPIKDQNTMFIRLAVKPSDAPKNLEYKFFPCEYFVVGDKLISKSLEQTHLDFTPDLLDSAEKEDVMNWAYEVAVLCMLVVSMPQFEHVEIERSEKLQRAREKSGKPRLTRMIEIRLRSELRAAYESEGIGMMRKPHWRRGHIRKLSSGKITPVSPCMVNFNGEVVEPKTYKVRN